MHCHNAVVDLPASPAMRPPPPRRQFSLLGIAGFIDDEHSANAAVLLRHLLLQSVPRSVFIPTVLTEKLLQGPRWNPFGIGDRFQRFPRNRPQLSPRKNPEMSAALRAPKQ